MRSSRVLIAYEIIKDKIFRRELVPGDYLVELKLVEELKMSRTPIRKAIDMLIDEGLVGRIQSKCTYVKSTLQDELVMAHELCEALDGMAAYLLAEQVAKGTLGDDDFDILKQIVSDMARHFNTRNFKKWAELDKLFHITFVMLSGNDLITRANNENYKHISEILWFKVIQDVNIEASNQMHMDLLSAVSAGDMENSRRIAQDHRRRIIEVIKSGGRN